MSAWCLDSVCVLGGGELSQKPACRTKYVFAAPRGLLWLRRVRVVLRVCWAAGATCCMLPGLAQQTECDARCMGQALRPRLCTWVRGSSALQQTCLFVWLADCVLMCCARSGMREEDELSEHSACQCSLWLHAGNLAGAVTEAGHARWIVCL